MASTKVEMSLDEIIKRSKKEQPKKVPTGGQKRRVGAVKRGSPLKKRAGSGIQKKKAQQQQRSSGAGSKATSQRRIGGARKFLAKKNVVRGGIGNRQQLNTAATAQLVKKLVRKALTQVNTGPARRGGGIRGKFLKQQQLKQRRGPISAALNTLNQRSKAIAARRRLLLRNGPAIAQNRRRQQQQVVALPATIISGVGRRRGGVGGQRQRRQPIQYVPVINSPSGPIAIMAPQQNRPRRNNSNYGRQPQLLGFGSGNQRRPTTVREQINALRRVNSTGVGSYGLGEGRQQQFVRQSPQFGGPRRRNSSIGFFQPQQQQRRFQQQHFGGGGGGRRVFQQRQRNQPFIDPPNFLQRI